MSLKNLLNTKIFIKTEKIKSKLEGRFVVYEGGGADTVVDKAIFYHPNGKLKRVITKPKNQEPVSFAYASKEEILDDIFYMAAFYYMDKKECVLAIGY